MMSEQYQDPYLDGNTRFTGIYERMEETSDRWYRFALGSAAVAVLALCFAFYVMLDKKYVPYFVEVDAVGQLAVKSRLEITSARDKRIVRASLYKFVIAFRTITPDFAVIKRNMEELAAMIEGGSTAKSYVAEYIRSEKTNPFKRAAKLTIEVRPYNLIQISDETWQVDWTEIVRDRGGAGRSARKHSYRAILKVNFSEPTSEKDVLVNPAGLLIEGINISPIMN